MSCCSTAGTLRAQGATEYLVLLAVVLIVALVSVALLGFFPGMASDAQMTQSKAYWSSATPISVVEWGAATDNNGYALPYFRIRNSGAYPIRITKMLGNDGQSISQIEIGTAQNISDYFYMAPGEEKYFSGGAVFVSPLRRVYIYAKGTGSSGYYLNSATSLCKTASPYGMFAIDGFGFEYVEYIDGQQITKRQVGAKPVVIACQPYT